MAQEPENRMLFDLRGRRKRVIQVIYVILAILMAASLVVIGMPGGLNPFSSGTTSINKDAAEANVERAERLQTRLASEPNNENVARELIRARFSAGQSLYSVDEQTGQSEITEDATVQLEMAADAWSRYVKMTGNEPDPEVAQLMAQVLFTLAQGSTVAQFQANIEDAAEAQKFVADDAVKAEKQGGPSAANQLTTLAIYQLYAQEFAAAEKTREKALDATRSDDERKQIQQQLNQTEKDARRVGKMIDQAVKQAQKDGGKSLQNPLGGLGSDTSIGGEGAPPTTP